MINLLLLACCHPDSAAQAVIASMLDTLLPNDPIVGEEDASELRKSENKELLHHITTLVNESLTDARLLYDMEEWAIGIGYDISPRKVRDAIDRGNYEGGNTRSASFRPIVIGMWT